MIDTSNRFALECIERAEGNPLFLEQLLRNAEGEHRRQHSADHPEPGAGSNGPSRLCGTSSRLQAASVIGKRFTLDGLRFLIEDESYRCDTLVTTDLVRPESGDYLFAHALIQEGVYSSLLHSRKRELHARAAQWYGTRRPVLHAEHLDRAQDPSATRI